VLGLYLQTTEYQELQKTQKEIENLGLSLQYTKIKKGNVKLTIVAHFHGRTTQALENVQARSRKCSHQSKMLKLTFEFVMCTLCSFQTPKQLEVFK